MINQIKMSNYEKFFVFSSHKQQQWIDKRKCEHFQKKRQERKNSTSPGHFPKVKINTRKKGSR